MADEKKKKVKLETAKKRHIQDEKKNARNKSFKAKLQTAKTRFLAQPTKELLQVAHGLVDKCVKKGIFQKNKGARVKSRLEKRVAKTSPAS